MLIISEIMIISLQELPFKVIVITVECRKTFK